MISEADLKLFAVANGQTAEQYKQWLAEQEDEDG